MTRLLERHGPWVILVLAFWPVWVWYARRTMDGVDEPLGLVALLTVLVFTWRAPRTPRHETLGLVLALALTSTYALLYPHLPPLGRAMAAVTAIAFVVSTHRLGTLLHLPVAGLLLLSLPVMSSLLFYAGYPLRRLVALASVPLLRASGYAVEAQGVTLAWNERLVAVDAPCSGVKMLWAAAFLALTLALVFRLGNRRTLGLCAFALVAVIAGNVLRATALFFVEVGLVQGPSFLHPGVGVAAFLLVGLAIVAVAVRKGGTWRSASSS